MADKLRVGFYPIKKAPYATMVPCPHCLTYHSISEYARVRMAWHGEIVRKYSNVYEIMYDTTCPMCRKEFHLDAHMKMIDGKNWKMVYYSVPKNSVNPLDKP